MSEKPATCAPNVYGLFGSVVNVFVLDDTESGVTVVDAGMPGAARQILRLLKAIGRTPQDVKHILITHADTDHVGGLKPLVKATGAQVYASAESNEHIQRAASPPHIKGLSRAFTALLDRLFRRPVPVGTIVSGGDVLDIAGGIRVLATPGHTPDHVSYYWERERVLFVGDLLNNRDQLNLTPDAITWDKAAAYQSARAVLVLDPVVICAGHGAVWSAEQDPDRIKTLLASFGE